MPRPQMPIASNAAFAQAIYGLRRHRNQRPLDIEDPAIGAAQRNGHVAGVRQKLGHEVFGLPDPRQIDMAALDVGVLERDDLTRAQNRRRLFDSELSRVRS